ncbi:hypothetical protein N0V93_010017 [Gnomoniopsis smithogilvyi]|uniref:Uncharacterized protein n=1 Tax=Gnomoniopsis smithogilvyi TaxID=1191159 RepID=A0A9W8YI39_9PEZI|nr:hypothetical protein N0V93_010017 [Gnomoniopsis smithogilvyi]
MLVTYSTLAVLLASSAVAAPLNINLGAYSPALVVGDGEISFAGGAAGAENLVNTLQGAAASQGGAVAQGQAIAPAAAAPAERAAVLSEPASLPVPGVNRELSPRADASEDDIDFDVNEKREEGSLMKRQSAGFDRALTFAEAALTKGPKVQLGSPAAGVGIIVDNNPTPAAAVTPAE